MKWFKHESTARHDVKIKILMQKHGAEGYGVYFLLLELIAEFAVDKNITEWGFVDKFHTVDTLSNECGVTPDKLRTILLTCNELDLFQKKESRLYCKQILKRLDDYAQRILRKSEAKTEQNKNRVRTVSEQSTVREDKIREDKIREDKIRKDIPIAKMQRVAKCPNKEEGHKGCVEFIDSFAESRSIKFPNYAKQIGALHKMLLAKYTFTQINKKIDSMEKAKFWIENGFDLMNVANEIGKKNV